MSLALDPWGVFAADVDRDGDVDVLAASVGDDGHELWRGDVGLRILGDRAGEHGLSLGGSESHFPIASRIAERVRASCSSRGRVAVPSKS